MHHVNVAFWRLDGFRKLEGTFGRLAAGIRVIRSGSFGCAAGKSQSPINAGCFCLGGNSGHRARPERRRGTCIRSAQTGQIADRRAHLRRAESQRLPDPGNRMEPGRKAHLVSRPPQFRPRNVGDGCGNGRAQGPCEGQRAPSRDAAGRNESDPVRRALAASRRKTTSGRPPAMRCCSLAAAIWCSSI